MCFLSIVLWKMNVKLYFPKLFFSTFLFVGQNFLFQHFLYFNDICLFVCSKAKRKKWKFLKKIFENPDPATTWSPTSSWKWGRRNSASHCRRRRRQQQLMSKMKAQKNRVSPPWKQQCFWCLFTHPISKGFESKTQTSDSIENVIRNIPKQPASLASWYVSHCSTQT